MFKVFYQSYQSKLMGYLNLKRISFIIFSFLILGHYGLSAYAKEIKDKIPQTPIPYSLRANVTEQDFFNMGKYIEDLYREEFFKWGLELKLMKKWNDEGTEVKSKIVQNIFYVDVEGGLARLPGMNIDSLALAICHEIGHALGGAPRMTHQKGKILTSVEGQADYFASAKCLKKVFGNRSENRYVYQSYPLSLQEELRLHCNTYLCARVVGTAWNYSQVMIKKSKYPQTLSLLVPSQERPEMTVNELPSFQCRLDTFIAGAVCPISYEEAFDPFDLSTGACMRDALDRQEVKGARPECWFVPEK